MRQTSDVAIQRGTRARVFRGWTDHARFFVGSQLAACEGFGSKGVARSRDSIRGDLSQREPDELRGPPFELPLARSLLFPIELGEHRLDVVLGERIETYALRGGMGEMPVLADGRLKRGSPLPCLLSVGEGRRLRTTPLFPNLRAIRNLTGQRRDDALYRRHGA